MHFLTGEKQLKLDDLHNDDKTAVCRICDVLLLICILLLHNALVRWSSEIIQKEKISKDADSASPPLSGWAIWLLSSILLVFNDAILGDYHVLALRSWYKGVASVFS